MGFIYLLYNDAGYGYIGQTSRRTMNARIADHKKKGNDCRSKILGEFDWLVLEEVEDEDLLDFERYYYDIYNEMFPKMMVNKVVPLRTKKEGRRVSREANREKRAEYQRDYREANKEKTLEYSRKYYEANKEKKLARGRELYHNKRKLITN